MTPPITMRRALERAIPHERVPLLLALADLPDEAWIYVAVWAQSCALLARDSGMQPDAIEAMRTVGAAAEAYLQGAAPTNG